MSDVVRPRFDHLLSLTDARGTFEHASFTEPRPEHGYCTDDMARVLIVCTREPAPDRGVQGLIRKSLRFLDDAQGLEGDYHNRMNQRGRWTDRRGVGDCWGRSVWALGTAVAQAPADWVRQVALAQFDRAARQRSPWPRAMAFAALGSAEVLAVRPEHRVARALLVAAADSMPVADPGAAWPWPEPRLSYANAVIPDALIAAGHVLGRTSLLQRGLDLLGWLLEHETLGDHLSVTPVGGSGPGTPRPAFDQQPIEAAALADACARAAGVDRTDSRWPAGVERAVGWFLGSNDGSCAMWDPATGGGYDGLQPSGPNLNEGAESTLALISTLQHARRLVVT